jgi:hypothetical protein
MNTSFKRKALTCAVLAGLGVASTAEAGVFLNQSGTGQVLIFPYYTVQAANGNAYNTYISVTNTTAVAKVLKVRFREGKTSAEVLDFNLYLSPNDMWVGVVTPDGQTTDSPARLSGAGDLSCTDPAIPPAGEPFKNFQYVAGADALPGTTLDRTREGYVEMFEMGTLAGTAAANVTHPLTLNTAPTGCTAMRSPDGVSVPAPLAITGNLLTPTGGLYGAGTLINVVNGGDFGYKADALDGFATDFGPYYHGVGSNNPTIGGSGGETIEAIPTSLRIAREVVTTENGIGVATVSGFADATVASAGAQAVASVFMHTNVLNDYILDTATLSNTDWVLTFPTKREFVNATSAGAPFTAIMTSNGACEPALFNIFNRDEQSIIPSPTGFSPQAPGSTPGTGNLCWESTIVAFGNGLPHTPASGATSSNVLGSKNRLVVTVPNNFQNGWANLHFTGAKSNELAATPVGLVATGSITLDQNGGSPGATTTYFGLPVTGFMVRNLNNAALSCTNASGATVTCNGNYAALFTHSYRDVLVH